MKEHPYFKNFFITEDGQVFNGKTEKYAVAYKNEFGYMVCNVFDPIQNKWKKRKVHRLVAEVYLPNPNCKREVNHKDSDKTNNRVSNLEWATSKENKDHAWANNLYSVYGEDSEWSVLSEEQVHGICRLMEEGARNIDLATSFGVHKDTISSIRTGRSWKHVSKLYQVSKRRVERKSPETIIKIAELLESGVPEKKISEDMGISLREVQRIKNRDVHGSLTKSYEF